MLLQYIASIVLVLLLFNSVTMFPTIFDLSPLFYFSEMENSADTEEETNERSGEMSEKEGDDEDDNTMDEEYFE